MDNVQDKNLADCFRDLPFEQDGMSDGRTFEGYAAVFNSPTRIGGWEGDFDETIAPGAFSKTIRENMPTLMFEHGRHPLIGTMPLGVITEAKEDSKGLFIRARLTDNWLVQPVRDAVRDGAITGMSFRFTVPEGGDTWVETKGKTPQRTLNQVDVRELGPVVFPAYAPTTASVRSLLDELGDELVGRSDARSTDGDKLKMLEAMRVRTRILKIKGII